MNTEITGKQADTLQGEIFYDSNCGLCTRGATWLGGVFVKRGFRWLPMKTPGTAARLGISDAELSSEMKVRFADGRVLGGVDAWASLFRSVWWLWPLGAFVGLPGVRAVSDWLYRWITHNRYRISGARRLKRQLPTHQRHAAFFEFP